MRLKITAQVYLKRRMKDAMLPASQTSWTASVEI